LVRLFDLLRINCGYSYSEISVFRPAARVSCVERPSLKKERSQKKEARKNEGYVFMIMAFWVVAVSSADTDDSEEHAPPFSRSK
jgi:hypothetical protein